MITTIPTRRRPRYLEDEEQRALMRWLEYQHPRIFDFTFHVPNGGARSKAQAGIFKALGVKAGILDVICPWPMGGFNGLAIEMKQIKAVPSDISNDQRTWLGRLRVAGWRAEVAPGFEHAKQIFEQYLAGKIPPGWQPWGE